MVLGQYYRVAKRKFDSYAKSARPYTQEFAKRAVTQYAKHKLSQWGKKSTALKTPYGPSGTHGQQKTTFQRRKRRKGGVKAKRLRVFKRKVRSVIMERSPMCMYQESWDLITPYAYEFTGLSGALPAVALNTGIQLVLGHTTMYALSHGGGANGEKAIMENYLTNSYYVTDTELLHQILSFITTIRNFGLIMLRCVLLFRTAPLHRKSV